MAWTTPKTWTSEPLTSLDLNTHLRDNLEALKDPPGTSYVLNESANYYTTSTSFVDVDGSKLALTISTGGGDVMVHFHGVVAAASGRVNFDLDVDGVRVAGDDGITRLDTITAPVSFTRLISGLAAGAHTFRLQWRVSSGGSATLYAGAGSTVQLDVHPQFWVREVS
jgi:hypothetical protein